MRNHAALPNIGFTFLERRKDLDFFLKLLVRNIPRERLESLKRFFLGRHGQTLERELDARKDGF